MDRTGHFGQPGPLHDFCHLGVVRDLPETMPIAREIVARFHLLDGIELRGGDHRKDGYGEGNDDVVLLSGVLHGETPDDGRLMLRKAHESLRPGGLAAVQEILIHDDRTGPCCPLCSVCT